MNRMKATPIFDKLTKVMNGSKSIITIIDSGKEFNRDKAIKASLLNSITLAECLKEVLKEIVESNVDNSESMTIFNEIFGGKKL